MEWDLNFVPVDEDMIGKREKELGDVRQSKIEILAKVRNIWGFFLLNLSLLKYLHQPKINIYYQIGKGIASIPLPIIVAEIEFRARLLIGFKFMSKYPHIKTVEYSFLETPKIDFILRPLKALDIMDVGI